MIRGPLLNLGGTYLHPFEPVFFLVVGVGFLLSLRRWGLKVRLQTRVPLLLFIAGGLLLLASVTLSAAVAVRPGMTLKAFSKWSEIILVALLTFWLVRGERSRLWLYWSLFASAALYAIWFLPLSFDFHRWVRYSGYEAAIALILVSAYPGIRGWGKSASVVPLVWVALRSLSRGVWLALAFLAVKALRRLRWRTRALAIGLSALGVTVLISSFPQVDFVVQRRLFTSESASNRSRLKLLGVAAEGFVRHPLLGIGAENFPIYMADRLRAEGVHEKNMVVLQVHNVFLQTAVEEGVLGLLGLLLLVAGCFWALKRVDTGTWMRQPLIEIGFVFLLILSLGVLANDVRFLLGLYGGLVLSMVHAEDEDSRQAGSE